MVWTIEAKRLPISLPIVGNVAGHLYFEIWDNNGNRVHQIHGFATDVNGKIKEVGTTDDFIKVYTYGRPGYYYPNATQSTQPHEGKIIYQGSQASVEAAMKDIFAAQIFINSQKLQYQATAIQSLGFGFGTDRFNSNSIFKTLLNVFDRTLDIPAQNIQNAINLGGNNPGVAYDIFDEIKWERNTSDASKPAGSIVEGTQHNDKISASAEGVSQIDGGAGEDILIGDGAKALLYGGDDTKQDIFLLSNNSFIMDGTGEDFTTLTCLFPMPHIHSSRYCH